MGEDEDEMYNMAMMSFDKLIDMHKKINNDMSDYYIPDPPPTLEESLRKTVPALKDAYDQYQIILKFAKAEHYAQEENNG